jgi:glycine cleavage system H protein
MKIQPNLKYASSDEWLLVEGNIATLGISDYAQEQLSDVVYVEMNVSVGDIVKKNSTVGTVESVKAASDVNTPVTGKIIEVNEALSSTPEMVNSDPFGTAWMLKIELSNPEEINDLMDAKAYEKYCGDRSH